MTSTSMFLLLLSIGLAQAIPIGDEPCKAQINNSSGPCNGMIRVPYSCKSAIADLTTTGFKSCDTVDFSWAYPLNNLTIFVVTPFTQQHQPYAIHVDNRPFKEYPMPIYRILDGKETEIKTTDDLIVEKSDSNYQVVLKFQAQTSVSYYLSFIRYNTTKL